MRNSHTEIDCGGNKNNFTNLEEYNQECNPNGKYSMILRYFSTAFYVHASSPSR